MKKLLLIGGGIAHAEILAALATAATRNADVTLVNPRRLMPWLPMVPGLVAGHYKHGQCHYDLNALARRAKAKFIEEAVVSLDPGARLASTNAGRKLEFDFASIDVDATTFDPDVPGLRQNALLARPVDLFLEGWERIVELIRDGKLRTLALVGGDAPAVELMFAMRHRLEKEVAPDLLHACGFAIVTGGSRLLEDWPEAFSARVEAECFARGISLMRGAAVTEVARDAVQLANGARLSSDVTVWAQGSNAPRWLNASGLACDERGHLKVDAQQRTAGHPHVFAAGECAAAPGLTLPANQTTRLHEARLLAANVQAALAAQALSTWAAPVDVPQWFALCGREALGLRAGQMRERAAWWLWRRKDWADRRALRRLQGAGL